MDYGSYQIWLQLPPHDNAVEVKPQDTHKCADGQRDGDVEGALLTQGEVAFVNSRVWSTIEEGNLFHS